MHSFLSSLLLGMGWLFLLGTQPHVAICQQPATILAQETNPYATIDAYARNCPESATEELRTLAEYLEKGAKTDREKARVIFTWIADNIRYDDKEYNSGEIGDYDANAILQRRKAVCDGYGTLYQALAEYMKLEGKKVIGYAKGFSYRQGYARVNHAWNIVKWDNAWHIIDVTWAANSSVAAEDGSAISGKDFDPYWFDTSPYEAIFSHYCVDSTKNLVEPPLSLRQFKQMPIITHNYFKLGFDGRSMHEGVCAGRVLNPPDLTGLNINGKMLSGPKIKNLKVQRPYTFTFHAPDILDFTVEYLGEETAFAANNGQFTHTFTPNKEGKMRIIVDTQDGRYQLLEYQVVK